MRQNTIHVYRSVLETLLRDFPDEHIQAKAQELSEFLCRRGARYQVNSRSITPAAVKKKVDMVKVSYKSDAQLFAKIWLLVRRQNKHKGISIIKEGTTQWEQIKEITHLATQFCNDFELPLDLGYKAYIDTIREVVPDMSLNKINHRHQQIVQTYEAIQEISSDPHPQFTEQLYREYQDIIMEKTGICNDYRLRPLKFIFFVKASKLLKDLRIDPKIFIRAQFKSLEWVAGVPEPSQIVGDLAIERLQKYLFAKTNKQPIKNIREELGL